MMNFPLHDLGKARQAELHRYAGVDRGVTGVRPSDLEDKRSFVERYVAVTFAAMTFAVVVASLVR